MTAHTWSARVWRARFRAVTAFEIRAQAREPLTTLYALVFGLLSLGYATSSAVELVSDRGSIPRTAPWALLLAFGGLTAFGQVITTMIATTAMLRDEAQRTRGLVATSGLGARTWFTARVSAALLVMLAVYSAMPLGIVVGTIMSGGDAGAALAGSAQAFAVITIPTVITVTVCLATAALLTQRVLGVLAAALALVGLWQLSLALVGAGDTSAAIGALLDPFGNAPVLAVTAGWSEWQRTALRVPFGGLLAANRALWFACSVGLMVFVLRRHAPQAFAPTAPRSGGTRAVDAHKALARSTTAMMSVRRFTASWMQYDGGWRIVTMLAVLNAVGNAMARPLDAAGQVPFAAALLLVTEHARLFLILLATVYAGELVWRERDVRVQQLVDALPVSRTALVLGRVQGLLLAQRSIVAPLSLAALVVATTRTDIAGLASPQAWSTWAAWSLFVLWIPFLQLTVLSLTVHVLLDRKVAAHLLLITGWVMAVILDGQGASAWWLRFADPAPLMDAASVNWGALATRGAYWSAVSAALIGVCWWRWPTRGHARSA
jgi:ABC-2 type transport system permease protein